MSLKSVMESCISDSSSIPEFYLRYFNWMVQVISVRCNRTLPESRINHILRVWDGHPITSDHKNLMSFSIANSEMLVSPATELLSIPWCYGFDILLFGEWISRAAKLKSGSIVILKNLHFFLSKHSITPILVLHEGCLYGRGIVEVHPKAVEGHCRYLKLMNDTQRVLAENNRSHEESDTTAVSLQEDLAISTECREDVNQIHFDWDEEEELSDERLAALTDSFFGRTTTHHLQANDK
ncbi:POT1PC domain-containing protein [Trichostrongylus colubriformis]|uniref:POT1PC domain-containing protein n=1 Tax=Trichostrongylus colubriformis TaxID=6319 RepID=A0AAN8F974_TRICO